MSERSKGDTSSSFVQPTSGRVVKNPLLSASVTGLTFDDFQNKPLLLPAAPPIVHPTPVASRESTPLVTVGKSSDIDTENLSEINLNDTSGTSSSNIGDTPDENSNSLIESTTQVDNSILSQAASSFSQLPSVASSVFSTFSKKFNSSTGRDDFNSNPQIDLQPFATPFGGQNSSLIPPPLAFDNQQQQQSSALPSLPPTQPQEPPTFYSPTEIPTASSGPTCPPPASSGQNTYRLSAKKKYAQIPGLSAAHNQEPHSLPVSASGFPPVIGVGPAPVYSDQSNYEKSEERKGGLFSLPNIAVPNVLQNLSGLVQSAAGISSQKSQEQTVPSSNYGAVQSEGPSFYQPLNPTGTEHSGVTFFTPPVSNPVQSQAINSSQVPFVPIQPPPAHIAGTHEKTLEQHQPIFQPISSISQLPPAGNQISGVPPSTADFFSNQSLKNSVPEAANIPFVQHQASSSRPSSVENQFAGVPPPTGVLFSTHPSKSSTSQATQPALDQQPLLFQPSSTSSRPPSVDAQSVHGPNSDINPSLDAFAPQQPLQPEFKSQKVSPAPLVNTFGPPSLTTTAPPPSFPNFFAQPTTGASKVSPGPPPLASSSTLNFFQPPPVAGPSGPPTTFAQVFTQPPQFNAPTEVKPPLAGSPSVGPPLAGPPLVGPPSIGPPLAGPPTVGLPSTGPPSTTFRLQKGTRLYKSPFQTNPNQFQPQIPVPQQNIFPPAPAPAPAQAVSFFNPQLGAPAPAQAVSLFNPQQGFAPPQEQTVASQIPLQASIVPPLPQNNTFLQSSTTTTPLRVNTPDQPPVAEAINFYKPEETSSASRSIISAVPETIPSIPSVETVNFFNPHDQKLIHPPKEEQSIAELEKVLENPSEAQIISDQSETVEAIDFFKTQEKILEDKTETLQKPSSDANPVQPTLIHEAQTTINPELEEKSETSTVIQNQPDQQNNILPPPPAVYFGQSTSSKETANFPPPPPQNTFENKPVSNPFRRSSQPTHHPLPSATSLASFFTPIDQGNNFFQTITSTPSVEGQQAASFFADTNPASSNIVQTPATTSQEPASENQEPQTTIFESIIEPIAVEDQIFNPTPVEEAPEQKVDPTSFYKPDIVEAPLNDQPVAFKPEENSKIASPHKTQQDHLVPESVPNLFSNFFDQPSVPASEASAPITVQQQQQQPSCPDPTTFFDSFNQFPTLGVPAPPPPPAPPSEDPNSQRIQNFFNNPPPKELDTVGDLNYNLVGSGLSVQNLHIRSLTPASNLAEPPSSSCSEFSELNSSLSAANRQPLLIQAADSSKVSPEEESIFELPEYQDLPEEILNEIKMANSLLGNSSPTNETYKPPVKHWFYRKKIDSKFVWTPFSVLDSAVLEEAFLKGDEGPNLVAVEGGRFDVNISERTKTPVYWKGEPIEVKRCSWFYKAIDSKYAPYEEETADLLEEEYKKAFESCEWHKKIQLSTGDTVVFHGPTVIVHFQPQQQVDSWGGSSQTISRPRVVKRDLDDFHIDEGESDKVDHLLFMVHGIGPACDLKMRPLVEVVDEFRSIALQLVESHYKNSVESGHVGRVEVLPVSWHSELHSDELGIDEKLKSITLESIPILRNFTNDTLSDILFYTSPVFCQKMINTVTASINSIYIKYKERNPKFQGDVSLAGHSLGSLIMFDLLCHQRPIKENEEKESDEKMSSGIPVESNKLSEDAGQNITYKMGQAGTGQPFISYPQFLFQPKKFFALGSPIGMFVTIRGIDKLGLDFRLPTCPGFYNIFHPYDPVAYRLEALVNPDMTGIPPVLIPHHKGRKRMHLELKETMTRVGADLKQRFFETFKTTLDTVSFLTPKQKNDPKELEKEVNKLLELQSQQDQQANHSTASTSRSRANSNSTNQSDTDVIEIDFPLGKLNDSKRVDYVLQEAPLEFINEYLFALSSHVCYWESEDTVLFVMKQIYNGIGISPDSQVPQQSMTIERHSSGGSTAQQSPTS